MAKPVNLYEAKAHLSQLVDRASRGEEIIIAKARKPRAKLVPFRSAEGPREPANRLGITFVANGPLPPEIQSAFETGGL